MLTIEEVASHRRRAESGDAESAFILYEHYESLGEHQEADKWLLASTANMNAPMAQTPDDPIPQTGREQYKLSAEVLNATLAAANSGDMAAAERLYIHYSFGEYDQVEADHWRATAARRGSERAQCDLAVALMDAEPPELDEARKWAAAAEASGSTRGHELVCKIDSRLGRTS
ncbi:hypothetical protein WJ58_09290 [Burkholderia ubonensis]|uniref:hypothetical protein n=1 Tax=Burkholderia ubonensis TaxID=101571 RepID=UPI0007568BDF|nr:hypothetical protein [Burkholderia ubonensis]KVM59391.1 hypothetical protein WJ58_09290 [Burkholderia ubonensis]